MATVQTIGGYAVLIGFGGLIYYLSQRKNSKAPRTKLTAKQLKAAEKEKPTKAKKQRKDGGQSSGDQAIDKSGKASKKKKKDVITDDRSSPVTEADSEPEEEIDNKEFARQLSSAKSGTFVATKKAESSRQKSVKQSKAQEKAPVLEASSDVTAPSSAAGGDADDDQSSLNSPELGATSINTPVANGGISDMLEAPSQGPSILRVTSPTNPTPARKVKAPAAFEPAETKKQRQNRKKAELKKAAREEDEKERKVLLEKQRRTAREAEGRAAKDGSAFMASKAPTTSAWTSPSASANQVNGKANANQGNVDLLDTYEPSSSKAVATSNSESEQAGSDWQKIAGSLSEEEQIRRLEEEDNWETVGKKQHKKKANTVQSPPPEKTEVVEKKKTAEKNESSKDFVPNLVPPTGAGQVWGMNLAAREAAGGKATDFDTDVQDSEWDVAGYGQ